MDLAKLVVRLEAQSSQLLTELDKANRKIDRFAAQTSKTLNKWAGNLLGVFSARALVQFGNDVLKAQEALLPLAQLAGTSVENISSLGYAAEQSGSDLETLAKGLGALSNTAADAAKGVKGPTEALNALGVSATNADGSLKDTSTLLLEIAEQFSKYEDGAAKTALAQDIFSKSGKALIPFLNQGAEGIRELQKEADRLGITISTEAAVAADEFNDKLASLGGITRGVVGRALQEITPIMAQFVTNLQKSAEGAATLDSATKVLATGLKLLVTAGIVVVEIFDQIGETAGAVFAAAAAVIRRDYGEVWNILKARGSEAADSIQKSLAAVEAVWSTSAQNIAAGAVEADKVVKETLIFGGDVSRVQEIKIGLQAIDLTPVQKVMKELEDLTKTQRERAIESFYAQKAALDALSLPAEVYAERLAEINKQLDDATGITQRQAEAAARNKAVMDEGKEVYESTRTAAEKLAMEETRLQNLRLQGAIDQETYNRAVANAKKAYEEAANGAGVFWDEAKRNAQDILGEGIYTTLKDGFGRGKTEALQAFGDMLAQMAAQAAAAQIFEGLFGDGENSGWLAKGATAIAGFFGGGRAMTGPVNPGIAYDVNELGNVERFVPDRPGRVEDMRRGGGMSISNTFVVSTPTGRIPLETQQQMATRAAQALQQAQRRNG